MPYNAGSRRRLYAILMSYREHEHDTRCKQAEPSHNSSYDECLPSIVRNDSAQVGCEVEQRTRHGLQDNNHNITLYMPYDVICSKVQAHQRLK
jgi:hypothetical protein